MSPPAVETRRVAVPYRGGGWAAALSRQGAGWVFLIPLLIFFIGWQAYPILRVLYLGFTNTRFLVAESGQWVWLENYWNALRDPLFQWGIARAAFFTVIFLPGIILLPMVLAVMIDRVQSPRLGSAYRFLLFLPAVVPGPLIFILWRWLYDYNLGPINYVLVEVLHFFTARNAPNWLGDVWLVLPAIAAMEVWWGLGFHTLFFQVGLAAIPKEMLEAAKIDGANEWNLFWRIIVPRLRPILLVLVVVRLSTAMAVIDEYIIFGGLNRGLPTYTWTIYMWDMAFKIGDRLQGYASAVGWLGTIAMLLAAFGLFRLFRPRD